jgi:hypothetical protein
MILVSHRLLRPSPVASSAISMLMRSRDQHTLVSRALKINTLDSETRDAQRGDTDPAVTPPAPETDALERVSQIQADSLSWITCSEPVTAAWVSSATASDSSHEAWLIKKMRSASTDMVLAILRISAAAVRFAFTKWPYSRAQSIVPPRAGLVILIAKLKPPNHPALMGVPLEMLRSRCRWPRRSWLRFRSISCFQAASGLSPQLSLWQSRLHRAKRVLGPWVRC